MPVPQSSALKLNKTEKVAPLVVSEKTVPLAYPLLFGRDLSPKPAFNAVLRVVTGELAIKH